MSPLDSQQQESFPHQQQGFLCALPPLPLLLPKLKDDGGLLFSQLHSWLSNALDQCKRSLDCTLRETMDKNPLACRLLPPQLRPRQVRDVRRGPHHLAAYNFAAALPSDSVAAIVASNGVLSFLNIYNTLLIVRLLLTWFPNPPQVIVNPLSAICDPYLNIFRGIIPPLGTIDLSPILAFFVLNIFTNTASALPAELSSGQSVSSLSSPTAAILTWSQKAWLKRQAGAAGFRKEEQ